MYKKITIIGLGYVGLGQALLFNDDYDVIGYDIDKRRIETIKNNDAVINDADIAKALARKPLNVTIDFETSVIDRDLLVICTPTHFDSTKDSFDLSSILTTLDKISSLKIQPIILIKSTIYVGATDMLRNKYPNLKIFFSPEFLREGYALIDNLYPHRIVVGYDASNPQEREIALQIADIYLKQSLKSDTSIVVTGNKEAEAIKLFANTYLALRVAFFNELDTYGLMKGLDTVSIINGVSLDPRIGQHYNNPSFGYGGYCLPKDSKQLQANYNLVPEQIISATVNSNMTRKAFIAEYIINKFNNLLEKNKVVGIYRLVMKKDSDNMRESSIIDIIDHLKAANIPLVIYEPLLNDFEFKGIKIVKDLSEFKIISTLIVTNRYSNKLDDVKDRVFTRDIKNKD